MTKTAVIALGGNALTRQGQSGTSGEMMANAAAMAASINAVIEAGWRVVVVHGNGPQVGSLTLQQEAAAMVPAQPLALLNAMTQGLLGSLIARAIDRLRGPGTAAALVTHVTVDPADAAFGTPVKPIGPFFEREEAQRLAAARGYLETSLMPIKEVAYSLGFRSDSHFMMWFKQHLGKRPMEYRNSHRTLSGPGAVGVGVHASRVVCRDVVRGRRRGSVDNSPGLPNFVDSAARRKRTVVVAVVVRVVPLAL